jgi:hypothetical protein
LPPGTPSTLQVTPRSMALPCTVAVNCWIWVGAATAAVVGETLTVNVATVRSSEAFCARLPDVPVTVTVAKPIGAEAFAARVSTLVELDGLRLKDAVTPCGKPDADNMTEEVKPYSGSTVIVLVLLPFCAIVSAVGTTDKAKLGAGCTVIFTEAL